MWAYHVLRVLVSCLEKVVVITIGDVASSSPAPVTRITDISMPIELDEDSTFYVSAILSIA